MEILEERFRSRFEWGLIADITLPDYETRMAILHKNEEMNGYSISEDVIKYIATNIKSNIRELEGAFNKVMAGAKLEKKEVTLELAEQALKDIISPDEKKSDHTGIHHLRCCRALRSHTCGLKRKQTKLQDRHAPPGFHVSLP